MEVVDRDDLVRVDEPARERRADEPGAARDQDALARQRHAGIVDGGRAVRRDGVTSRCGSDVRLTDARRARSRLRAGAPGARRSARPRRRPHDHVRRRLRHGAAERVRWTLRCDPVGGDHPRRVAACRELGRLGWRAFRPMPKRWRARRSTAARSSRSSAAGSTGAGSGRSLTRVDGCQIARWDRVPSLLPPAAP